MPFEKFPLSLPDNTIMKRILDINTWDRKEHFNFFKNFEEPFFGVTVELECTIAYQRCKQQGFSFFLYYLHKSLHAVNEIEPFRYRIADSQVVVYDRVHATPTILRPDNTFGFSYIDYSSDFETFAEAGKKEINRIQNNTGLVPAESGDNVIHYSSLPWIRFTSFSHARRLSSGDSCPKISFGKIIEADGKRTMPLSIHVHHALMDGYHVGQYMELYQQLMNES